MSEKAKMTGFRTKDRVIEIESPEGLAVTEVCKQLGIPFEGTTFVINDVRLSAADAANAMVKGGDRVVQARKSDGGFPEGFPRDLRALVERG